MGSLSKAGKVRSISNKKEYRLGTERDKQLKYYHKKKHLPPRLNNKRKYNRYLKKLLFNNKRVKNS